MRKLLFCFLALCICACEKKSTEAENGDCVRLYFTATAEVTKTMIDGHSILWTGEENVVIWYKDAEGVVESAEAEFVSCNGNSAQLSVMIPSDANKDELYAEVNGVKDNSSDRFPWGSNGPRTMVPAEQEIVAGSYDPAAIAMAARWVRTSEKETPVFAFKNLHNLLKITIDNRTSKIISEVILSSSSSLICKNYWTIKDDGSLKQTFSTGTGTEIKLKGSIAKGRNDYYFVVPTKNNNGANFKLDDMKIRFQFETSEYYEKVNTNSLELGYNSMSPIGTFVLEDKDLVYPYGAPFGTCWGTAFMKSWKNSGFTANASFTGLATEDTREVVTATATASCSASINSSASGNERLIGKFQFQFVASQSGAGTLSFWSKAGSSSHTASILKNGEEVALIRYSGTTHVKNSVDIQVSAGDIITIQYNKVSSSAVLYCGGDYNSNSEGVLDRRIWWNINAEAGASIKSPDNLTSDNSQDSFFNEM